MDKTTKEKKLCKYCETKLIDKKVYEKSFVMDYCPNCDIFFPKEVH